ncbi:ABC-type antimicrobial peptide transport system, permease component [Lacrimispora sphenoides]|jgi:ABC-type antimicrobial peptide transport system permease subunit|uniref:ABC transporter permease n=1 Tax=Lacrimispora sphenoides TaxID=29370 RepID=UPI0008B366AE|nr:ABC transporter permease [Lacrimispora sphenoides]SEU31288.1 ABC-type antimicrobial peptide transport system, permease component [Lacrimispora sphenoides]
MKFSDLLSMSVNNLRRRKLRTFLTVLGVLIGTASIVVMVSLGIGFNELTMEQIASYGSLTEVSVYSNAMWGGNESSKDPNYMTDDVIAQFERIDHVNAASPLLETSVMMTQGAYQAYINLIGVTQEYMKNIPLKEGQIPEAGKKDLQMIVGNMVARNFSNPKSNRNNYYDDSSSIPDIDFINRPMFVIFDMDAYYQSQNGGTGEGGVTVKPPKKYLIPTAGLVEGGPEDWNNYSYSVYVDLEALKSQLKQIFKKKPIPNQPTNKKGKPYNYFIYQQAVVEVDDMNNVTAVQKAITDMGFQANSNMEWLEQSQKQAKMVQALLGGIGAVSLFVAAIGIANTMMMSIYERTKEIGILKVLGCDMNNIRNMFLLESGFIGFLGGITGILFSYGVSFLINRFLSGRFMSNMPGDLSRIPPWLSLTAVGFAVFVGMAAGFFPALRAMKLSPLAAIRNE